MGVNSLPKTVIRQRRDCDLNPGPSAPESSKLTTRLLRNCCPFPYHLNFCCRIFPLPNFSLPIFPLPLVSVAVISYINFVLPCFLTLSFFVADFLVAQFSGCRFFLCRFFQLPFFSGCPFYRCRFHLLPLSHPRCTVRYAATLHNFGITEKVPS